MSQKAIDILAQHIAALQHRTLRVETTHGEPEIVTTHGARELISTEHPKHPQPAKDVAATSPYGKQRPIVGFVARGPFSASADILTDEPLDDDDTSVVRQLALVRVRGTLTDLCIDGNFIEKPLPVRIPVGMPMPRVCSIVAAFYVGDIWPTVNGQKRRQPVFVIPSAETTQARRFVGEAADDCTSSASTCQITGIYATDGLADPPADTTYTVQTFGMPLTIGQIVLFESASDLTDDNNGAGAFRLYFAELEAQDVITAFQIDETTMEVQIKTRKLAGWWDGAESDWTTVHTGTSCDT